MVEIADLLKETKQLLSAIIERKSTFDSLLNFPDDEKKQAKLIFNEAQNIFEKVNLASDNIDILEGEFKDILRESFLRRKFRASAIVGHIAKADNFSLSIKGQIEEIQQDYFKKTGKQPSLGKITKELTSRGVKSPTGDLIWYRSSLRLILQRIQKIDEQSKTNQLER